MCRRFGTFSSTFIWYLWRWSWQSVPKHPYTLLVYLWRWKWQFSETSIYIVGVPLKMELTECSETSIFIVGVPMKMELTVFRNVHIHCWCTYEEWTASVPKRPYSLLVYLWIMNCLCSETSARKIQTLGNHPKEWVQLSEHGEEIYIQCLFCTYIYCT